MKTLVLGAVAYDAKVVPIWEGFRAYFEARGLPFDFVLYSNYERQVEAHLRGELDVAWNSPLAWIETDRAAPGKARAIAMRDTDRDLTSVVIARPGITSLEQLRGKRVGVGAADSPQATLIPLLAFAEAGIEVEAVRHDVLLGKHGDHIGGERDAVKALVAGTVDAACVIDGNRLAFAREGLLPAGYTVIHQTPPYDHCNFTVLGEVPARFAERLVAMSYEDPVVRPLLDMEGLKAWLPGRTTGYAQLERAVDRFKSIEAWLARPR
jgi:ABC-type phosphate/phosphonate transport system substrate-binding protein